MNTTCLIGRITKDLEKKIKIIKDKEMTVLNFVLAVRRDKEKADFVPCVAFGKLADIIFEHSKKGNQIGIVGRIHTGSYDDKEGNRRYTFQVIAKDLTFTTSKDYKKDTSVPFHEVDSEFYEDEFPFYDTEENA